MNRRGPSTKNQIDLSRLAANCTSRSPWYETAIAANLMDVMSLPLHVRHPLRQSRLDFGHAASESFGAPAFILEGTMPRYHFNVYDNETFIDCEGTELPNLFSARQEAIKTAGRVLDDHPQRLASGQDWAMQVTNDVGLVLFQIDVHLSDAPAVDSKSKTARGMAPGDKVDG